MKPIAAIVVLMCGLGGRVSAGEALFTNVYAVPPTFFTNPGLSTSGWKPPKTLEQQERPLPMPTAKEVLESAGITFPEGASAIYNCATSQLIVRNTREQMELVEAFVDSVGAKIENQIYVTVREIVFSGDSPELGRLIPGFFDFPEPSERTNGNQRIKSFESREAFLEELTQAPKAIEQVKPKREIREVCQLTDPQFQVLIRALSQRKEADIHSFPSVMARSGQAFVTQLDDRRCGVIPVFGPKHERIEAELFLPEVGKPLFATDGVEPEPTLISRVQDGNTVVIAERNAAGEKRLIFLNLRLLDPAGIPASEETSAKEAGGIRPNLILPQVVDAAMEPPTQRLLRETILPEIDYDDLPFGEALELLREEILKYGGSSSGLFPEATPTFMVSTSTETLKTGITLLLKNVSAEEALRYLTALANCKFEVSGRIVRITSEVEAAE